MLQLLTFLLLPIFPSHLKPSPYTIRDPTPAATPSLSLLTHQPETPQTTQPALLCILNLCAQNRRPKGFLYRIEHRSAEGLGVLLFHSLGHYCPEDGQWHRSRGALLLLLASWVIMWWWPTPAAPVVLNEKGGLHHDRCLKGTCTQSVGWLPALPPPSASVHTAWDRQVKVLPQIPRPSSTPNHPPQRRQQLCPL